MSYVGSLELFRVGVGPSSSHTVGPMRAAKAFADEVTASGLGAKTSRVTITLYGSLGATGAGHGTTNALIAGLWGAEPETCDPDEVANSFERALVDSSIRLGEQSVPFTADDLVLAPLTRLPHHSNGMKFQAFGESETLLHEAIYFSVGGGFIERDGFDGPTNEEQPAIPYPFSSAIELMGISRLTNKTIAEITLANDDAIHGHTKVRDGLDLIWSTMVHCIESGLSVNSGVLPGPLTVKRRAGTMADKLRQLGAGEDMTAEWLQAYAIAVNEENAAGRRVVTAPTNGAAGIIPAVGYWAQTFKGKTPEELAQIYIPTAAAIGSLYKRNASISGAEAGCQGEVGSACSMAAGGLTALLGGTIEQIENAAEIAMEHNLGLTCDPVGGFVQMPCIERNAIAAGTAVAATRLALLGDGTHKISLDTVIETMRQTGIDMSTKYKETSMGGLAVNVVEC